MAASEGYTKCVSRLIAAGANVSHRTPMDNTTAIFHAVNANRFAVVLLLLQHGANPLDTRNENNETMAEVSRQRKNDRLANLLESWVAATPDERHKICAVCAKYKSGEQKRCAKCKARWYCSEACQKKDWSEHKQNCKAT